MKAITLWQPWASLWACGAKLYETRSWGTSYRGPIAIHAGLAFNNDFPERFAVAAQEALRKELPGFTFMHALPRGAIIATGELSDMRLIIHDECSNPWLLSSKFVKVHGFEACLIMQFKAHNDYLWLGPHRLDAIKVRDSERIFGNYSLGRWAWGLNDTVLLPKPIPVRGKQGLWNWEAA